MLSTIYGCFLFVSSVGLLVINTIFCGSLVLIGGFFKFLIPISTIQILIAKGMTQSMRLWGIFNGWNMKYVVRIRIDVQGNGLDDVSMDNWYLVLSNHASGLDIPVLCYVFRHKIPMLKFFLKKQLLYIPFMGWGCWALDMPFMHRYSANQLKKKPHLKGKDLENTRKACLKFKKIPTTVMNFVEGGRFTQDKKLRQQSPYKHLLKPKASGLAFAISSLGDQFDKVLNVTLMYPESLRSNQSILSAALMGRLDYVIVQVDTLDTPPVDEHAFLYDREARKQFQRWLNHVWKEKDECIAKAYQAFDSEYVSKNHFYSETISSS